MGFDAPELGEDDRLADDSVERADWSNAIAPPLSAGGDGEVCFVDGVRRVELRLIASDERDRAPGLFGSFAIGCVRANGRGTFGAHEVVRALVLGGGIVGDAVSLPVGAGIVRYEARSVAGNEPDRPLRELQRLMREAEGAMARKIANESGALVLADGRLSLFDPSVVGVVKRFSRRYLPDEKDALLARLEPGERTPLFVLSGPREDAQRYCWYTRLVPMRAPWHDHAGLVRCETGAAMGLDAAVAIADRVSVLLPRFAGRATDPRAPQNLAPVGALESRLRRHMGDERLLRRALTVYLIGRSR